MKVQLHLTAQLLHHRDAEMRDFTVRNGPSYVVGYNGSTSGADNNFITVPFNAVGYNTADIQQIVISDEQVPPCKLIHAFVTEEKIERL